MTRDISVAASICACAIHPWLPRQTQSSLLLLKFPGNSGQRLHVCGIKIEENLQGNSGQRVHVCGIKIEYEERKKNEESCPAVAKPSSRTKPSIRMFNNPTTSLADKYHWGAQISVHALCRIEAEFEDSYAIVSKAFPQTQILRETSFAPQLKCLISSSHTHIVFGVDDALFCSSLPLGPACRALDTMPHLSCVHLRLSPGISYSHPAQQHIRQPKLVPLQPGPFLCVFRPSSGTKDWDYPFDLCGSMYRKEDMQILCEILGHRQGALSHPNLFEAEGNKAFAKMLATKKIGEGAAKLAECGARVAREREKGEGHKESKAAGGEDRLAEVADSQGSGADGQNAVSQGSRYPDSTELCDTTGAGAKEETRACLAQRAMVVVTVNRVQAVYKNPIYECGSSPAEMNLLIAQGQVLDEHAYMLKNSNSVHVGGIHLSAAAVQADASSRRPSSVSMLNRRPRIDQAGPDARPKVSFVMPVHNGVPFIVEALDSLMRQDFMDWECVCVDDASTDTSLEILQNYSERDDRFRICQSKCLLVDMDDSKCWFADACTDSALKAWQSL